MPNKIITRKSNNRLRRKKSKRLNKKKMKRTKNNKRTKNLRKTKKGMRGGAEAEAGSGSGSGLGPSAKRRRIGPSEASTFGAAVAAEAGSSAIVQVYDTKPEPKVNLRVIGPNERVAKYLTTGKSPHIVVSVLGGNLAGCISSLQSGFSDPEIPIPLLGNPEFENLKKISDLISKCIFQMNELDDKKYRDYLSKLYISTFLDNVAITHFEEKTFTFDTEEILDLLTKNQIVTKRIPVLDNIPGLHYCNKCKCVCFSGDYEKYFIVPEGLNVNKDYHSLHGHDILDFQWHSKLKGGGKKPIFIVNLGNSYNLAFTISKSNYSLSIGSVDTSDRMFMKMSGMSQKDIKKQREKDRIIKSYCDEVMRRLVVINGEYMKPHSTTQFQTGDMLSSKFVKPVLARSEPCRIKMVQVHLSDYIFKIEFWDGTAWVKPSDFKQGICASDDGNFYRVLKSFNLNINNRTAYSTLKFINRKAFNKFRKHVLHMSYSDFELKIEGLPSDRRGGSNFTESQTEEPVAGEPVDEKSFTEKSFTEKPVVEEPVAREPVDKKSFTEKPVVEVSVSEESVAEKSVDNDNNERININTSERKTMTNDKIENIDVTYSKNGEEITIKIHILSFVIDGILTILNYNKKNNNPLSVTTEQLNISEERNKLYELIKLTEDSEYDYILQDMKYLINLTYIKN